jgi:dynein heavy chain
MMTYDEPTTKPEDGCYIKGMFLEGARWDAEKKVLADSYPKVLFSAVPIMWLRPMRTSEIRDKPHFPTACYRESSRRGVLSTTGHSTNYVMTFKLPSADPVKKWVKRGCALLLQLDN